MTIINYILAILSIALGIYFIRNTYKKPAVLFSTDLKGYIAGVGFIFVGYIAIIGELDFPEVLAEIWKAITK